MMKNPENNFSAQWVKYSDYEIVEVKKDKYIKPKENATYELYDPFECADDILVDILNLGRVVEEDVNKLAEYILEFIKKYGLLGELTYLPLNSNIAFQRKVFLPKGNQFTKKDVISVEEYLQNFLVCDKNKRIEIYIPKNKNMPIGISNLNEITPNFLFNKGTEYNVVFSKGYSEQTKWILEYAVYLYTIFKAIETYYQEKIEQEKKADDIFIKSFKANNITCKIEMLKAPTLIWDFNSLKQAIDTMFLLNETTERKTVKMCKHCGKAFSSQNLKAEYCSSQCRNQANVYKSRAKNKE